MSSAVEAETCGISQNAQTSVPIRQILQALSHEQPPTPIKADSIIALGFTYNSIHLKIKVLGYEDQSVERQGQIEIIRVLLGKK